MIGGGEDSASATDDPTAERIGALQEQIYDLEDRVAELDGLAGSSRMSDGEGASDTEAGTEAEDIAASSHEEEMGDTTHADETTADTEASAHDEATDDTSHADEMTGGTIMPTGSGASSASGSAHWTYAGDAGATHWGDLDEAYVACAEGLHQSPIEVGSAVPADIGNLTFAYQPGSASMVNNGHTVQVDITEAGGIVLDDHEYDLAQFHVHAPSEHTVSGRALAMEIHFVHKDADGKLAVVGVFVEEGTASNPAANALVVGVPSESGATTELTEPFDPTTLLPAAAGRAAIRYDGSLTTPPCTEGVEWSVLNGTITMSAEQIETFKAAFPEPNARPVQPLNERTVSFDVPVG